MTGGFRAFWLLINIFHIMSVSMSGSVSLSLSYIFGVSVSV